MQVAGHMYAVKRGFESRATPAHEKPPALPEDHLLNKHKDDCLFKKISREV